MVKPTRQVFDPALVMNKSKIIMNRFGSETNKIKSKNLTDQPEDSDGWCNYWYPETWNRMHEKYTSRFMYRKVN